MKIAIVIERFRPGAGGNERSTEQIARALVARGHDVTILANDGPDGDEALPGGRLVIAGGPATKHAAGLWLFSRWAERRIAQGGYDVSLSVSMSIPADVVQPRGGTVRETLRRNVARRPGAPARFVKTLALALNPKQRVLLALERRTLRSSRTKRLVAISRYVADQLFVHYAVSPHRIAVIPNAASVARFDADSRAVMRRRVRACWSVAPDAVVFLFAAMNPGLKGLDAAMSALAEIRRAEERAVLLVAGAYDPGMLDRAQALGIGAAVRVVGMTRRIDALYAAADATVLPTWYDPASKVVIESLLHGVPAISTCLNGASPWIADPRRRSINTSIYHTTARSPGERSAERRAAIQPAGRVIDSPRNHAALVGAMRDLCDAEERARCAAAAAQTHEALGMDRHVEALEKVLGEAAHARRGPR
ncbi:MAG: glycosyltransferase [Planctomycetes bacterium]|jgi:glycosyltransferase involved in cell wall biosynthesis|nr:glycosyltransferase [Planctomycetota bacterium]